MKPSECLTFDVTDKGVIALIPKGGRMILQGSSISHDTSHGKTIPVLYLFPKVGENGLVVVDVRYDGDHITFPIEISWNEEKKAHEVCIDKLWIPTPDRRACFSRESGIQIVIGAERKDMWSLSSKLSVDAAGYVHPDVACKYLVYGATEEDVRTWPSKVTLSGKF